MGTIDNNNNKMSTDDNDNNICANCGKGEEDSISLKKCGACMSIRYCSATCQKAHRPQHKRECKKRAAELHDESLFKQPPQLEDCQICFLRLPSLGTGVRYNSCCGKIICSGCIHAGATTGDDKLCPFCRAPAPTSDDENNRRVKKRIELGDAQAMYELGCDYSQGLHGLTQNMEKALELWHRAGELGKAAGYHNIGCEYINGEGVERDEKKAIHYWELAAMNGSALSRFNLGNSEIRAGNMNRALKHYMIAVGVGDDSSMKTIQEMYKHGYATKDDYVQALKAYQAYLDDIKSDDRDKAAAYSQEYKYI